MIRQISIMVAGIFNMYADYSFRDEFCTQQIMRMLCQIHEYRGKQASMMAVDTKVLDQMMGVATTHSKQTMEAAHGIGQAYGGVLRSIKLNFRSLPPKPCVIANFHRYVTEWKQPGFRDGYVMIDDFDDDEKMPATDFEWYDEVMAELCPELMQALQSRKTDSLLVIAMFICDFWCRQPFANGNEWLCQLLLLQLLLREGYFVGKFISLEARHDDLGKAWQHALEECSVGWDVGEQRYAPFVEKLLGIIAGSYGMWERVLTTKARQGQKKSDRIESLLYRAFSPMRKDEIMLMAPDISKAMVEKVLADLLYSGSISKLGAGRGTRYVWNHEEM